MTTEDSGISGVALPSLPPVEVDASLPPETGEALWQIIEEHNQAGLAWEQAHAKHQPRTFVPMTRDQADQLFEELQRGSFHDAHRVARRSLMNYYQSTLPKRLAEFVQRPEIRLIHVARLTILLRTVAVNEYAYILPENKRQETELADFRGHIVEAFRLRSQATRLGFTRGQTGDGGWFYEYVRTLPGLGITVEIQFSGNSLPKENRPVALIALRFLRTMADAPPGASAAAIPLSEVPAVLLSECRNDLQAIAALGSGFDPDWESKACP